MTGDPNRTAAPELSDAPDSRAFRILAGGGVLTALYAVSHYNYLVFHTLAEFFAVAVAWSLFLVLWNTREAVENQGLVLLGIAYLFIGGLDLVHTLSYKGMGALGPETGANPATQLWILARFMESATLCLFASQSMKTVRPERVLPAYGAATALGLLAIFHWNNFPVCYVDGAGLTTFKIVGEYLVSALLILALHLLKRNRAHFDGVVYRCMAAAIVLTVLGELCFTFYVSVYGLSNLFGHFFKILSFYFVYLALIHSGLRRPYTLLFRRQRESDANYRSIFQNSPIAIERYDADGRPVEVNGACMELFGVASADEIREFELFADPNIPGEALRDLRAGRPVRYQTAFDFETIRSMNLYRTSRKGSIWIDVLISPLGDRGKSGYLAQIVDITERVRSERELRASERKFRELFDNSSDAVFIQEMSGRLVEANHVACGLYGYDRGALLAMSLPDIVAPGRHSGFAERLRTLESEGRLFFESVHRRRDGTFFPVEIHCRKIAYQGKTCVLSAVRDVTERQQRELAHARILDSALDGILTVDSRGRIRAVNPAAAAMLDYTQEELRGLTVTDIDANEDAEASRGRIRRLRQNGHERFETRHRRRDGRVIDVEVSCSHMAAGDGGFIAFVRDISERKRREREARINHRRLEFANELAALQEVSEQELCDFALERMCELSDSRIGFLGLLSPEEDVLKIQAWSSRGDTACLAGDPPTVFPVARAGMWGAAVRRREAVICNDYERDHPDKRGLPEGHAPVSRFVALPVFEGERIAALAAVGNKATDYREIDVVQLTLFLDDWWAGVHRRRLVREREALQAQLQRLQKMESIGTLAGGIAHDFNNILFPIIGMSEMLLEDLPPGSPEVENAEEIFRAGKRGSDLVKQILAFSRQSEHRMIPTRIQPVLREVIKLARSSIPAYIDIQQTIQRDCGMVMADPSQIHQVAMNIVTNAYHAVEDGGGKITVALKQVALESPEADNMNLAPGNYAVLSVADTGHGMPERLIGKIFDPYFTTKEQGKGTGLGLAVAYGIVKEHNGGITVESGIGKGTTFDVFIPLMERQQDAGAVAAAGEQPAGDERILLVDDEMAVARLEKQMLERLGYRVTSHCRSTEALAVFQADPHAFDLVITDMAMPSLTGADLAEKMLAARADIPIIICTGFSERIDAEKARSMGIEGFLMKPIVRAELSRTVRNVLDASGAGAPSPA